MSIIKGYLLRGRLTDHSPLHGQGKGTEIRPPVAHVCSSEISHLDLLPQRSLIQAQSHRGFWLRPAFLEATHACSSRDFWHGPVPVRFPVLGLVSNRLLAWVCSHGGCWLRPTQVEFTGLGLLLWRSLALAWALEGYWLKTALLEVAGLGLLPWSLLAWACSGRVIHSDLVLQMLLAQVCSGGGC